LSRNACIRLIYDATGAAAGYPSAVSYDVMFYALAPGDDPDEALERLLEDEPPRDPQLEAELARVLTETEPSLEPVRDEQGVVQLDGPEMQAYLEPGHLLVTIPYWESVDLPAHLRRLEAIAGALREWRGWVAFDPQLGRRLELPADAPEVERRFAAGVATAQAVAEGEQPGEVYRPKPPPAAGRRRWWPPWRREG
jgi:hypothetical protein